MGLPCGTRLVREELAIDKWSFPVCALGLPWSKALEHHGVKQAEEETLNGPLFSPAYRRRDDEGGGHRSLEDQTAIWPTTALGSLGNGGSQFDDLRKGLEELKEDLEI